jgi:hypothetical protein
VNAPLSRAALRLAPEALTLEVLAAAIGAAQNALRAVHPDIDEISTHEAGFPPPSTLLAAQLVARLDELHDLLGWYQRSCRAIMEPAAIHDELF